MSTTLAAGWHVEEPRLRVTGDLPSLLGRADPARYEANPTARPPADHG